MRIQITLALPREAASVAITRHTVRAALVSAGVTRDCVDEVEVALSEACTNVLQHAASGPGYEVAISLVDAQLSMEIVDAGVGFGEDGVASVADSDFAEGGRGLALMRALTDQALFDLVTDGGHVVRLMKRLRLTSATASPAQSVRAAEDGAPPTEPTTIEERDRGPTQR